MSDIIRPTSAAPEDALAEDGEFVDLLNAMQAASPTLQRDKLVRVIAAVDAALVREFGGPALDAALCVVATVAANQLANLIMQVQRASPISDAGRDGRVKAVSTFMKNLLERAVTERALVAKSEEVGLAQMAKINARLQ